MFEEEVASLGLRVNCSKRELVCLSSDAIDMFPTRRYVPPSGANLLHSPIEVKNKVLTLPSVRMVSF